MWGCAQGGYIPSESNTVLIGADSVSSAGEDEYNAVMYSVLVPALAQTRRLARTLSSNTAPVPCTQPATEECALPLMRDICDLCWQRGCAWRANASNCTIPSWPEVSSFPHTHTHKTGITFPLRSRPYAPPDDAGAQRRALIKSIRLIKEGS